MDLLIILVILAILLPMQFLIYKAHADNAEQENVGEGKPWVQFLIRYWWLVPTVIVVSAFLV